MSIVLALCGAVALFSLMVYSLRFLYGYRVKGDYVEIVMLGAVPIIRVSIASIRSVREVSWTRAGIAGMTLRFGNRLFSSCVMIERNSGIFRKIVVTPTDPSQFIALIEKAKAVRRTE